MKYPVQLTFKLLALAQQITGTDAQGKVVFHIKQKMFKLKEAITVYADVDQRQALYEIKADRIIDFSARYNFTDASGKSLGAVKRKGMRSLWKAHFEVLDGDRVVLNINEENAWIQVLDAVLGMVPYAGILTGYFFHPAYLVSRPDGKVILRLQKQAAFFEGSFKIEKQAEMSAEEEERALLSLLMMVLLERNRA